MKYFLYLLIISGISISAYTQKENKPINLNPHPNGEKWIVGGLRPLTAEDKIKIANTPKLQIQRKEKAILPYKTDNSLNKYFRPIFNQSGGSCAQASGVGYIFTYELNFERDYASNISENQYPSHYTWNFLNGGADNGSWYFDGWDIIRDNGCPNTIDWGGMAGTETKWMNGYDKYYHGMHNSLIEYNTVDVSTPEGLETLKNWLYDHGNGASVGGLANFAVLMSYATETTVQGSEEFEKPVITRWGTEGGHAMTFIGYNDSIKYDFNNDGKYTNNLDINNDSKIDMKDWEIGALLFANSWGTSWGDNGKCYMMYKLLAEKESSGGIGNTNLVHVLKTKTSYGPRLTIKTTIQHNSREKLQISAGVSANVEDNFPAYTKPFSCFNYQGGNFKMSGGYIDTLEIGLDITELLGHINSGDEAKFFLIVQSSDGVGKIKSFSIIDYTNNPEGEETSCLKKDVEIQINDVTLLSISKAINIDKVAITTSILPTAAISTPYSGQLNASGGEAPYKWAISRYIKNEINSTFPNITSQKLTPSNNDDGVGKITLGFDFNFYGNTYNEIYISTDGSVLFENNFEYIRTAGSLSSYKAITPFGADLLYSSSIDEILYQGDENSMTIRWKTSSMYNRDPVSVDFAVKLFPNGEIEFYYGNISKNIGMVIGVSDGISPFIVGYANSSLLPMDLMFKLTPTDFEPNMIIKNDGHFEGTPATDNVTYNINFTVSDNLKIKDSKVITFTVGTPIAPVANFSMTSSVVEGEPINLTDLSENYPTTWEWTIEDGNPGISNQKNPVTIFTNAGNYEIKLKVINDSGEDSITKTITVNTPPSPLADFYANETEIDTNEVIYFTDQSSNYPSSRLWSFEGGEPATSTDKNPVVKYPTAGVYKVILTVTNSGGSNTLTKTGYITVNGEVKTAIEPLDNSNALNIYPNPNKGMFSIEMNSTYIGALHVKLLNIKGQVLYKHVVDKKNIHELWNIETNGLPQGIYTLQIITLKDVCYKKIMIF